MDIRFQAPVYFTPINLPIARYGKESYTYGMDCKYCGCAGWFFNLTEDGLCGDCGHNFPYVRR